MFFHDKPQTGNPCLGFRAVGIGLLKALGLAVAASQTDLCCLVEMTKLPEDNSSYHMNSTLSVVFGPKFDSDSIPSLDRSIHSVSDECRFVDSGR
jgi:hypothetical protein